MPGLARRRDRAGRRVRAACYIAAAFAALLLSGCRAGCGVIALDDERLAGELRRSVSRMYPERVAAVHRAILTVHRRQFAFTGYVVAGRPEEVKVLATSEFGSTAFEVERSSAGARVVRSMEGLRRSWLLDGAARDAYVIYLAAPGEDARPVRHADGGIGFVEDGPRGVKTEFQFDPETHFLKRYTVTRRGRISYEARFSDVGSTGGSGMVAPRRVDIIDRHLGYSLAIHVLRLQAADR